MTIDQTELDRIRACAQTGTDLPLYAETAPRGGYNIHTGWYSVHEDAGDSLRATPELAIFQSQRDADLFAGARPTILRLVESHEQLEQRNAELREAMVKLTRETPYPEELEGWQAQRAALIAKVGTLQAEVAELGRRLERERWRSSSLEKCHTAVVNAADEMATAIDCHVRGIVTTPVAPHEGLSVARHNYEHVRAIVVGPRP